MLYALILKKKVLRLVFTQHSPFVQHKIIENLLCFLSFAWVDFSPVRTCSTYSLTHSQSKQQNDEAVKQSLVLIQLALDKKNTQEISFGSRFGKFKLTLYPGSLSFSFLVVGLSVERPDHVATRILGGKNICWKGGVAEFPQCQGDKSTVSRWEDCCHFPTGVFTLMETFRQIFILRIVQRITYFL